MKKKGMSVRFLTQGAVIAAIYVALVMIFNYCSFGPVQFRIGTYYSALLYTGSYSGAFYWLYHS